MSWNGTQFSKPFIMLHQEDLASIMHYRGYAPGDEIRALFPSENISTELALQILLVQQHIEEAVNLLCYAITPRVGVWWAYLCLRMVQHDIAQDLARDGLTPAERRLKAAQELAAKLSDTSDIDALVDSQKQRISDISSQLEEEAKNQNYLDPAKRIELKLAWVKRAFAQLEASLPPGSLGSTDGPLILESVFNSMQESAGRDFEQIVQHFTPAEPQVSTPSSSQIFEAARAKTQAVPEAIKAEMQKHFPLQFKGMPPSPSPARKTAAVEAALRWLLVPTDANGQLACQAAIAAKTGPESMLAYAAFWSSTNLQTETGLAPTTPSLPPEGISKTLLQLALLEGGDMDYDTRYAKFLELGIQCADGTCTWDEFGNPVHPITHEVYHDNDRDLRVRSGFGRMPHGKSEST